MWKFIIWEGGNFIIKRIYSRSIDRMFANNIGNIFVKNTLIFYSFNFKLSKNVPSTVRTLAYWAHREHVEVTRCNTKMNWEGKMFFNFQVRRWNRFCNINNFESTICIFYQQTWICSQFVRNSNRHFTFENELWIWNFLNTSVCRKRIDNTF